MTAAELLRRAAAAGVRLALRSDGTLRAEADLPPPPDLVADLRRHRAAIAAALAAGSVTQCDASDAGALLLATGSIPLVRAIAEAFPGAEIGPPEPCTMTQDVEAALAEGAAVSAAPRGGVRLVHKDGRTDIITREGLGLLPSPLSNFLRERGAKPCAEADLNNRAPASLASHCVTEAEAADPHEARRAEALTTFARAPIAHVQGWRVAAALRAAGADVALDDQNRIVPTGLGTLPEVLRDYARANAEPLRAWLRLERAAGARAPEARPPYGTRPTPLREGVDYCAVCGPPVPGTVSLWWCAPGTGWRCDMCCPPPDPAEDDRVRLGYGLAVPLPDDPDPATETDHGR